MRKETKQMKLNDALFNWLQIKVVVEARPTDQAAQETYQFFSTMLHDDHAVEIKAIEKDETMYSVSYIHDGKKKKQMFDREAIDILLDNIEKEPKFNDPCITDAE